MTGKWLHSAIVFALTVAAAPCQVAAAPVVVKLGTLVPEGSAWHVILKDMAEKWKVASNGQVQLRIFAGGVAGDEPVVVEKMRIGQYQAAALSIVGLSLISPESQGLSVPELFASFAELDYVRERVAAEMEEKLAAKGFVVLNWGDAGWVRFFTTKKAVTPAEMRPLKMFVWTGDEKAINIWRDFGFTPVPLAATDILPSLQTGLIDAVAMTAASALATQTFNVTKHMLDIHWSPLVGATVITSERWNRVPEELKPKLLQIGRDTGRRLRDEIRQFDADAVVALKKHGVEVHAIDAATEAEWKRLAEKAYPRIKTDFVPPAFFDRVMALRDEYRKSNPAVTTDAVSTR